MINALFTTVIIARLIWAIDVYRTDCGIANDLRIIPLIMIYGEPQTINQED